MQTNETAKAIGGAAVSISGAVASNMDGIEQMVRIGAGSVAILSGCVVTFSVLYNLTTKRKDKSENKDSDD